MKKGKLGFTLVEVALFLAISGLLFFGITIGVQNSVNQQRKNDSVQSFMEFLRGIYDEVLNVQNTPSGGKSDRAIYGKLVTFGESTNLAGVKNNDNAIFTYTVIGEIGKPSAADALGGLKGLKATVAKSDENGEKKLAGFASSYTPKWSAQIEPACDEATCLTDPLKGMLLVVRHPSSGKIVTYFTRNLVNINAGSVNDVSNAISPDQGFNTGQIDFCVNPDPGNSNVLRSDVRIAANAQNSSGIELVGESEEGYKCGR